MTSTYHILGFGAYTPETRITNVDLLDRVDTSDEWIVTRTGIRARYMLDQSQNASDAGVIAAQRALAEAGLAPSDITHVLTATCTPDHLCPSTACLISGKLGIERAMAFDINAACSGFVYGLDVARGMLLAHPEATILFVCTEALTRRVNWKDRSTCVLFGDGAAAVILSKTRPDAAKAQISDVLCRADGSHASLLIVGGGTSCQYKLGDPVDEHFFVQMEGREVFKHAVRSLTLICRDILQENGCSLADVDLFIPHQANLRIIEAVGDRLGLSSEQTFVNVDRYGNTSAASIPLAIEDARQQGVIKPGMRVLLATFGGGFTYGAALVHF